MTRKLTIILLLCLFVPGASVAMTTIDPTQPYLYGNLQQIQAFNAQADLEWALSGVKFTEGKKTAILNGRLVKEGDDLDGARVIEIKPAEVILLQGQQRIAIRLLLQDIKSPASGETE